MDNVNFSGRREDVNLSTTFDTEAKVEAEKRRRNAELKASLEAMGTTGGTISWCGLNIIVPEGATQEQLDAVNFEIQYTR